jgi:hypothetical protein
MIGYYAVLSVDFLRGLVARKEGLLLRLITLGRDVFFVIAVRKLKTPLYCAWLRKPTFGEKI